MGVRGAMKTEIRAAIAAGVPAFNAGRHDECARVYGDTAEALERNYSISERVKAQFATARAERDATRRAWGFRHGFDALLAEGSELNSMAPNLVSTSVPASVVSSIEEALEVGVPAFNSGDAQLCAEVYEVCAKDIMSQVSAEVSRGIAEADKASAVAASAVDIGVSSWGQGRWRG